MRTCGPADWRTGKLRTELADRVRILPTCVATVRLPRGGLATLRALEFTLFMSPLPSLPPLPSIPPFLSRYLPFRHFLGRPVSEHKLLWQPSDCIINFVLLSLLLHVGNKYDDDDSSPSLTLEVGPLNTDI